MISARCRPEAMGAGLSASCFKKVACEPSCFTSFNGGPPVNRHTVEMSAAQYGAYSDRTEVNTLSLESKDGSLSFQDRSRQSKFRC
jgi:hypothetical protein